MWRVIKTKQSYGLHSSRCTYCKQPVVDLSCNCFFKSNHNKNNSNPLFQLISVSGQNGRKFLSSRSQNIQFCMINTTPSTWKIKLGSRYGLRLKEVDEDEAEISGFIREM